MTDPKDVVVHKGDLELSFCIQDGRVFIDFSKSVSYIGLLPDDVDELARTLMRLAHRARTGLNVVSVPV